MASLDVYAFDTTSPLGPAVWGLVGCFTVYLLLWTPLCLAFRLHRGTTEAWTVWLPQLCEGCRKFAPSWVKSFRSQRQEDPHDLPRQSADATISRPHDDETLGHSLPNYEPGGTPAATPTAGEPGRPLCTSTLTDSSLPTSVAHTQVQQRSEESPPSGSDKRQLPSMSSRPRPVVPSMSRQAFDMCPSLGQMLSPIVPREAITDPLRQHNLSVHQRNTLQPSGDEADKRIASWYAAAVDANLSDVGQRTLTSARESSGYSAEDEAGSL